MTVRGWCRTTRAGVFAAVCVLLAALGHATMSATPVPWWAMGAGAAGTGAVGWLLAGRERGRTLIVVVVTAAQAVLHETFTLAQKLAPATASPVASAADAAHALDRGASGSPHTGSMATDGLGGMGGMDMGGMDMSHVAHAAHALGGTGAGHAAHGMSGLGPAHDMAGMEGMSSFGMFAAHLLAALLCGLWLAHGERGVFRVLGAAAARLAAPLRLLLAAPAPPFRPVVRRRREAACPAPVRRLLCSSLTFRGPPAGVAAH
ncbi:hypothetical protein ACFWNK_25360 [Streptomyces sp. NPDC058417]|uniref:hypothetical protein n=1 Tax=unclassified Streptomyces TaxID=2593676 RepID=UPI00365A9244